MIEQDKKHFSEMMQKIGMIYGKEKRDINSITPIYFSALQSYELSEVRFAFNSHVTDTESGQFMPKPADIIRQITGNKESNAFNAWSKVEKAIRTVGIYATVCFDDPVIHKVISDMGGWISLNEVSDKEFPFKANEFQKRYMGHLNKPLGEFNKTLPGLVQADKSRYGEDIDESEIKLIGDSDKAVLTYQSGVDKIESPKTMKEILGKIEKQIGIENGKNEVQKVRDDKTAERNEEG